MNSDFPIINHNHALWPGIEARLCPARKTKAMWAKLIDHTCSIQSLEGVVGAEPGDYLCRGIAGECWSQKSNKLFEKYLPTEDVDLDGWRRFDPRPDSVVVDAAQINFPFRVIKAVDDLRGKAGDYVVRSRTDETDIWIVDRDIFEGSYVFE